MNKKQFKKYVEIHGEVYRNADYSMYTTLMQMHEKQQLNWTGKWLNYKATWVKDGIMGNPVFGEELTYADCLSWEATFHRGNIVVTLTLHDKPDIIGGGGPRCQFRVTGVPANLFEDYIRQDLEDVAARQEEKEERERRRKRRMEILEQMNSEIGIKQKVRS